MLYYGYEPDEDERSAGVIPVKAGSHIIRTFEHSIGSLAYLITRSNEGGINNPLDRYHDTML